MPQGVKPLRVVCGTARLQGRTSGRGTNKTHSERAPNRKAVPNLLAQQPRLSPAALRRARDVYRRGYLIRRGGRAATCTRAEEGKRRPRVHAVACADVNALCVCALVPEPWSGAPIWKSLCFFFAECFPSRTFAPVVLPESASLFFYKVLPAVNIALLPRRCISCFGESHVDIF